MYDDMPETSSDSRKPDRFGQVLLGLMGLCAIGLSVVGHMCPPSAADKAHTWVEQRKVRTCESFCVKQEYVLTNRDSLCTCADGSQKTVSP